MFRESAEVLKTVQGEKHTPKYDAKSKVEVIVD